MVSVCDVLTGTEKRAAVLNPDVHRERVTDPHPDVYGALRYCRDFQIIFVVDLSLCNCKVARMLLFPIHFRTSLTNFR